jgi:hypothetical protein|tara:strand:+ start:287 stop:421 length:135 start_codon:yes stop_codon:yes gene_type:complete
MHFSAGLEASTPGGPLVPESVQIVKENNNKQQQTTNTNNKEMLV